MADPAVIELPLSQAQQALIRSAMGKDAEILVIRVQELEERIAPRTAWPVFGHPLD